MKLPEEFDNDRYNPYDRGQSKTLLFMIVLVSAVVLLILIVVISNNDFGSNRSATPRPAGPTPDNDTSAFVNRIDIPNDQLRVEDLDFWHMYPPQDEEIILNNQEVEPEQPVAEPSPTPDPSEDGRHTLIERRNGTSEWILINPYITRNNYDPLGFILRRDRMGYFEQERQISKIGIDLSSQNGKVDFRRVKNDGIDFVMLRVGARGYESGHITVDDDFTENLDAALNSGLNVGVYFFSQAINAEEATEEANLIIEKLAERKITYPVVFSMDQIAFDTSRIDKLSRAEKTEITDTFCNYISGAGYVPMIQGTKQWLIEQIDLTKLMNYEIWLAQPGDLPDYPYKFQIWNYTHKGSVAGVNGDVNMNICFIDYTAR
ncbi:MAG: glycoside hydrolase family 25 protein [Lachnospiraceae bacterium]|nr:glycoside hydrolase family 25 protein [Lachnospiraceae bacterium]